MGNEGVAQKRRKGNEDMDRLSKAEWLQYIADNCIQTLRKLQDKESPLSEEEWALADLCGGYIHTYNILKDNHLIDPLTLVEESTTIH